MRKMPLPLLLLNRFSQSCPTVCDPIDGSPSGSSVPGILQARTLEWDAISFTNAGKFKVKGKSLSCIQLSATPRTAAHQAPPSMGFSRQEYWSGLPVPSPYPAPTYEQNPRFFFLLTTVTEETIKFSFPSGSSWSKKIQQFPTPGRQALKS